MGDADRGIGLVHVLPPRARRPKGVDLEIGRIDVDVFDFIDFSEDGYRAGRGVNPTLGFTPQPAGPSAAG